MYVTNRNLSDRIKKSVECPGLSIEDRMGNLKTGAGFVRALDWESGVNPHLWLSVFLVFVS